MFYWLTGFWFAG